MVTHDTKQSKGKEAIKETKLSNGTEIRELVCVLSDIAINLAIDTAYSAISACRPVLSVQELWYCLG